MKELNYGFKNYKKFRKGKISLYEMAKNEARRFCLETGMHGFQFIAKPENGVSERFIWTFISFGALLTALILSSLSWIHSSAIPTYIATDSMQDPITNYFYPAIAICNLNKISKSASIKFLNETLKVSNIDYWLDKMSLLAQLFFSNYDTYDSTSYHTLQHLLDKKKVTAENALLAVTPSCFELLLSCMWKGRKMRCDRLFQELRTPEGICCTFNNYAFKNWTFSGYMSDRYKPYARKLASCGHNSGVKVLLKHNPDDYLVSEVSAVGAKIMVLDPYTTSDWGSQRILIPLASYVYVDINPSKIYASNEIKSMSLKTRNCVLSNERQLNIYTNYSYLNCINECRMNIIRSLCDCLPFYYRNIWLSSSNLPRICNLKDVPCLSANKQRYISSVPGYDIYRVKRFNHKWGTETSECNCIPDCESRNYVMHSTMGKLALNNIANNKQFFVGLNDASNYSVVTAFFKELTGTRSKRDVLLTWATIFGVFGGLLGLCLGFTFLAVVDVIYTFTLKLGLNVLQKKQNMAKVAQIQKESLGFEVLPVINKPVKVPIHYKSNIKKKHPLDTDIWFIN